MQSPARLEPQLNGGPIVAGAPFRDRWLFHNALSYGTDELPRNARKIVQYVFRNAEWRRPVQQAVGAVVHSCIARRRGRHRGKSGYASLSNLLDGLRGGGRLNRQLHSTEELGASNTCSMRSQQPNVAHTNHSLRLAVLFFAKGLLRNLAQNPVQVFKKIIIFKGGGSQVKTTA